MSLQDNTMHNDEDIIIHPLKTKKDREIPQVGILFVNPAEAAVVHEELIDTGGQKRFLHNSRLSVSKDNTRFAAGPAIGAPSAVLVMEKLIALGATTIILMGWCGAVDSACAIGDILVPTSAVCGEGTSIYYSGGEISYPGKEALEALRKLLEKERLPCKSGAVWSTDAPYRESRKQLEQLQREKGVVGVDMEFSALCSVACFRGIDFAAVLVVSDELWRPAWRPGFKNSLFQERCAGLRRCLVNTAL